jgi:hypothetical protein
MHLKMDLEEIGQKGGLLKFRIGTIMWGSCKHGGGEEEEEEKKERKHFFDCSYFLYYGETV